jgi:hypothetical protein
VSQIHNRIRELQRIFAAGIAVFMHQGVALLVIQLIERTWKREFVALGESVPRADFQKWITGNEPDEDAPSEQVAKSHPTQRKPVIGLLTPVWNPSPDVLEATIRSALADICPVGTLSHRWRV